MDLIYFSPVPWNSIAQRPHFFIKQAIIFGFKNIIWINPTPSRFPQLSDFRRLVSPFEANSFEVPDNIKIMNPRLVPIEPVNFIYRRLNNRKMNSIVHEIKSHIESDICHVVIGKPSLLAIHLLDNFEYKSSALDLMDNFPCFFKGIAKRSVSNILNNIISRVDKCLYSCSALKEIYALPDESSLLTLNACDSQFFEAASKFQCLEKKSGKLIFGYVGTIAAWFDWEAVCGLAKRYPESEVRIIGPNYVSIPNGLPKNIKLFPAVEHSAIGGVISDFDYGIIPFKVNELTDSVDPVKYYEYRAYDLPVISTRFGQMSSRIEAQSVYDFQTFAIGKSINSENTVTWPERFIPFFSQLSL
ncbi:TPA: glycosyltransferase [Vibrio cholerae]